MMLTSCPSALSASASCHTRRSKGQGRFSTMMRTRHLPGDTVIAPRRTTAALRSLVPNTDEINDGLAGRVRLEQRTEFLVGARHDDHLGSCEQLLGPIQQEPTDVRNMIQNVLAIRTHEARKLDVTVIHRELVPLADQLLRERDHRAFAQIV